MTDKLPPTHVLLRRVWSVSHLVIVALISLAIAVWWVVDNNGWELVSSWWAFATERQRAIAESIRFPWD